jgi:hypothetical protein
MKENIKLEFCLLTNPKYQEIRNRHYVENHGCHGQQIHFLIWYNKEIVGIISGASSVYAVKARDDFFEIPKSKQVKQKFYLPAIINNTVFRLELHEKNLATCILAKWRKLMTELWEQLYNIPVIGFETFVVETDTRKGCLYLADNWTYCGKTAGSTKFHCGLKNKHTRISTDTKLIYCIKNPKATFPPTTEYKSSWKAETEEEKIRALKLKNMRTSFIGKQF